MCCLEFDNEKSHNLTARIMHALMPSLSFPWYIYLIFDTLPVFPIHTWKIPTLPSPTLVNSFHMYQRIYFYQILKTIPSYCICTLYQNIHFLLDTKKNPNLLNHLFQVRSNSIQMLTFNFQHFLCNEFLTFFGNAGILQFGPRLSLVLPSWTSFENQ